MKLSRKIYAEAIVFALLCICLAIYYAVAYQYHFFWQEQNQIYLYDGEYLSSYFDKPAWLGCMAGDYLTQFYYYIYAGPVILAMAVTLTAWLAYRSTSMMLPRFLSITLTTAFTVWIVACSFNSFFRLSSLICVMGGVAMFIMARPFRQFGIIFVALAYWLFGFGCIAMAVLYIINAISKRKVEAAFSACVAVALVLLTPMALKMPYLLHYDQALLYPGIAKAVMPETEVEQTLAVDNEYYFGNYDKAISNALSMREENAVSAFYYYLTYAKRDSLPEYLLKYGVRDLGTLNNIGETTPRRVIDMMNDLYYELGDMMYAERAAMMRNVFSDQNRNVRMIRRLAEINLATGDTIAAKKYLRILSKTHAYRKFASNYIDANGNIVKNALERTAIYKNTQDTLRIGDNCRTILLELLESNPDNTMALDYLLCTDLLLKDMDSFKADYDRYCMDRGKPRLRSLYQQALMIYLAGTEAPEEEWSRYIKSPELLSDFKRYNEHRGSVAFYGTYWYYFDSF